MAVIKFKCQVESSSICTAYMRVSFEKRYNGDYAVVVSEREGTGYLALNYSGYDAAMSVYQCAANSAHNSARTISDVIVDMVRDGN